MNANQLGEVSPFDGVGDGESYLFLSGADMDPTRVRQTYPGARFVARGWVEAKQGEVAPDFGPAVAPAGIGEIWGIVIDVLAKPDDGLKRRQATSDDGRTFTVLLVGERLVSGNAKETLAAAQYWELPPVFVTRLKQAVALVEQA